MRDKQRGIMYLSAITLYFESNKLDMQNIVEARNRLSVTVSMNPPNFDTFLYFLATNPSAQSQTHLAIRMKATIDKINAFLNVSII